MALTPGSRFGAYDVQSLLGVGGMGEVYRARDTRLGRDVALKVVPAALAEDRDRRERFDREARALAALNHPAIGAIYDVAEDGGVRAIVLELVEGQTLEERLRGGPLPMAEALTVARAIAEALDVAHDRGLVHRDLKPANVKITPGGDVKLLDFGLAKALLDEDHRSTASTITGTRHGTILGTAAYMSPEQARGQAVDKRADVWAFGCVLFELLTGRAAFGGATWSDSIARTLTGEPDWTALPPSTPRGVVHLLERCLQKDPKQRLRGLGGIELALDRDAAPAAPRARWAMPALGALGLGLAAALGWSLAGDAPAPAEAPVRFEVSPSIRVADAGSLALSPNGRHLVFMGTGTDGRFRLWERSLASLEARPIAGTEGEVAANTTLFWSPDSRMIGFYADGAIKRVHREGGQVQIVCTLPNVAVGGSWNRQGDIVVGDTARGLVRCGEGGGDPAPVTLAGASPSGAVPRTVHLFPTFLPDGRRLLYLRVTRGDPSGSGLYIADLDRPPNEQSETRLLDTGFAAKYAPASGSLGRILFMRNRGLWAAPFDHERLTVTGEALEVTPSVGTFRDGAFFDTNGPVLVYRTGVPDYRLTWRNRRGEDLGQAGDAGQYTGVALSPDGTLAVVARENRQSRADQDLWVVDLRRNATTRFATDPMPKSIPAWSADGRNVLFAVGHDNADIRLKPLDGGAERTVLHGPDFKGGAVNPLLTTLSVSADGELLTFNLDTRGAARSDIWILPLRNPQQAAPLIQQEFDQGQASISPDRQWLVYVSNETGRNEVFVRPLRFTGGVLPATGSVIPVSRGGGRAPRWRADSRELFFQTANGAIMAAPVTPTAIGEPVRLFDAPGALPHWGIAATGDRFLLALPGDDGELPFTVVLNWAAELR